MHPVPVMVVNGLARMPPGCLLRYSGHVLLGADPRFAEEVSSLGWFRDVPVFSQMSWGVSPQTAAPMA